VVLNAWLKELASGDQHRLTGSGSTLEALCDDALLKSTYFTFLLDVADTIIAVNTLIIYLTQSVHY